MKKRKANRFFDDLFTMLNDQKEIKINIKVKKRQGMSAFTFNMQNHLNAINKIKELNKKWTKYKIIYYGVVGLILLL